MEESQMRERATRWLEEGKDLLALLAQVLANDQRLNAKSHEAERETERLRRELAELRKELGDAKQQKEEIRRQDGDLHKELDEVKKENLQLRAEKEEAAQAFARLLDTVQATNQIAPKLGVTRSPFARRAETPAPNPAPHE